MNVKFLLSQEGNYFNFMSKLHENCMKFRWGPGGEFLRYIIYVAGVYNQLNSTVSRERKNARLRGRRSAKCYAFAIEKKSVIN